ncbi:MAG TPA: hypothetical protein VM509_09995, partial [Planctomycetota bacterium]|nr:hypothetical protein [Planctomycetota bacterium]
MSRWLAWTLGALFALALVLHAHGPLLRVADQPGKGFSESDLRALLSVEPCLEDGTPALDPAPYLEARAAGQHPLGAVSLTISSALWSDGGALGAASPTPWRIENLLLLIVAAAGAGVFLRRLALPWLGDEHARAAAWVATVLCLVHPLACAALVSVAARGDLLALAAGTWACVEFLRGRQLRKTRAALRAGALALVAGFSSDLAWALPFVLGLAEFLSARRHRPWLARARTTAITFCAYGLCVATLPLLRGLLGLASAPVQASRSATETAALALEKLGVLALPVNPASASFAAYLLAAAVLLVALEPAFSAARSAPRSWSLILAVGSALVFAASFFGAGVRVQPGDFTRAEVLAPGLFAVSGALALASTALSGLRRALVPAILATGWAAIAHEHASAWSDSITRFDAVRADVAEALAQDPRPAAVLLFDVPELVRGFAPLDRSRSQNFLAAPACTALDLAELRAAREQALPPVFVAAPTRSAFVQFARTERFAALRAGGIAVVREDAVRGKSVRRLPLPAPTTGSRRWFVDNSATTLDWDALTVRSVSARGPRATDQGDAPLLGWNASDLAEGQTQGIWIDHAGEPRAYFAVADSVEWLCAGRILLAWP